MPSLITTALLTFYDLNDAIVGGPQPTNPTEGVRWLDESVSPPKLMKWTAATGWAVQQMDLKYLDPDADEKIEDATLTLANIVDDNKLTFTDRVYLKDKITAIVGMVQADTTTALPTLASLDVGLVGEVYSLRRQALNVGLVSSHSAYKDLGDQYTALKTYFDAMTPKPWDTGAANKDNVITVTSATFRDKWLKYYTAADKLAEAIALKSKQNVDEIEIGGRNLYLDSYLKRVTAYSNSTLTRTESNFDVGSETNLIKIIPISTTTLYMGFSQGADDRGIRLEAEKKYTLTFKARGNVTNFNYTYFMRNSAEGVNSSAGTTSVSLSDTTWTTVTIYKDGPFETSTGYILIGTSDVALGKWFEVKEIKLDQGSIGTAFSIAPEDLAQDTDDKLDNVTTAYTAAITNSENDITIDVEKKISDSEGNMIAYTDGKVTQTADIFNIKFTEIETIQGEHGDQLAEVNSYFDFSPEGLNIGKSDSPLQININNEQMDFIDNGNVVAYVNGQKMYINTAEILQSIIVGNHKIEKFNTNITLVKWVGE